LLHQVGDLFELNIKLRCRKVKSKLVTPAEIRTPSHHNYAHFPSGIGINTEIFKTRVTKYWEKSGTIEHRVFKKWVFIVATY
jgi:hypothetical protein